MDGTPIYDIKPYVPYADCHPEAIGGFASETPTAALDVSAAESVLSRIPPDKLDAMLGVLRQDPRPRYQNDPNRIYGLRFSDFDVRFQVRGNQLTVLSAEPADLDSCQKDPGFSD